MIRKLLDEHCPAMLPLFDKYEDEFRTMPASIGKHHFYKGGLYQHIEEVMRYVKIYHNTTIHELSFESMLACAFIHDFNKIGAYQEIPVGDWRRQRNYSERYGDFEYTDKLYINQTAEVVMICAAEGIKLSREEIHCITFHHGGWAADAKMNCKKLQSGALLHYADMLSCGVVT